MLGHMCVRPRSKEGQSIGSAPSLLASMVSSLFRSALNNVEITDGLLHSDKLVLSPC